MTIDTVMTLTEAAERWKLSDGSVLRNAIRFGRIPKGEYKQSGGTWLVTEKGVEAVYGREPRFKKHQFVAIKDGQGTDFGFVLELLRGKNPAVDVRVVLASDEEYGGREMSQDNLVAVHEGWIPSSLAVFSERQEEFYRFIIQLNNIPELKKYHIEENEKTMEERWDFKIGDIVRADLDEVYGFSPDAKFKVHDRKTEPDDDDLIQIYVLQPVEGGEVYEAYASMIYKA